MSIFEKLFGRKNDPGKNDGLQQQEREALLDLLLYCKFVDNHLSLAEEKIIQDEIEQFTWDSGTGVDIYIATATDRVRKAKEDPVLEEKFLKDVSNRLESVYSKETAGKLMAELFRSDGETDAEKAFAEKMSRYLQ